MNRNENHYYKYQPSTRFKYTTSTNGMIGTVQQRYSTNVEKKIDLSKQKENDRAINYDKRSKRTPQPQESKRVASSHLTFKTMVLPAQIQPPSNIQNTQQTQQRKPRQRKEREIRQIKRDAKQIERVSSALSVNSKKQVHETKLTHLKIQTKQEDPRKNSEKRNSGAAKFKRTKQKQPLLSDFICNEEMETIQPKSSRVVQTQKSKPTLLKTNIIQPLKQGIYQQIMQFQQAQGLINLQQQAQQLLYLGSRQNNYAPDPHYIQKKQKNFTWFMRSILFQWMMHVSFQYKLKRDTFHLAVSLSDLFFSKVIHIPKTELQLVGAAAMYLSAKIQERQPLSVVRFAESTDGKYQPKSILEMQSKIVKNMKWELNPPTITMWANKIMQQWDLFLEQSDYGRNHPLVKEGKEIFFKKVNKKSLFLFLQVMQVLDTCVIQIQSLQYKQKPLVCSIIYLVLKKQIENISVKQITQEYPRSSNYLLDEQNLLNDLFRAFVEYTFGFLLLDLLPTIQYCSTFFGLRMDYQTHQMDSEESKLKNFQQFTSYQTYNPNTLSLIKRRPRGIIEGIYAQ